ncbi:MAG: hypothetical protein AAF607_04205 [Pseudomonadota bacterium]
MLSKISKQYVYVLLSVALSAGWSASSVHAASLTTGAGSAVTSPDAMATFTGIQSSLFVYEEDGLRFTTPTVTNNGAFDAFNFAIASNNLHYAGGNNGFTEITAVNGDVFTAVELLFGDGNTSFGCCRNIIDTVFAWNAERDGMSVGSGFINTPVGSIVGVVDAAGFDTLQVAAWPGINSATAGSFQAIAIDDVSVEFLTAVPVPPAALLFGSVMAGAGLLRRRVR